MVRRSGYPGVAEPARRFEPMRSAIARLQALERDHAASTPYGAALGHAVVAIRLTANLSRDRPSSSALPDPLIWRAMPPRSPSLTRFNIDRGLESYEHLERSAALSGVNNLPV